MADHGGIVHQAPAMSVYENTDRPGRLTSARAEVLTSALAFLVSGPLLPG
jgi:hypothetical protein